MVTLSPAELRKRNNFNLFVNRIKTNGYFTINESNGQRVQITQRLGYELNSVEDLAGLRDNRGSINLPTGTTGSSSIRLSQLYKDAAFVTRTQNTNAKENLQIKSVREQLEKIKEKVGSDFIKLKVGNNTYEVTDAESTSGTPKSDMNFIGRNNVRLGFCSLKDGATAGAIQQWGGASVSREPLIAAHPEVVAFVKTAREMFPTEIPQGTTVAREISDKKLRMQGIYGSGYGGTLGVNNVDVLLQGTVKINSINFTEYKITGSAMTHSNGSTLPPDYQPVLMAIYKGDRSDYGIKNARINLYSKSGRTKREMI
tara:strand:+ start:130 stop:1068 length:939 start_codon:yes stop_codon:yes gene_type:complete